MPIYDHVGRPIQHADGVQTTILYDHRGHPIAYRSQQPADYGHAALAEAARIGEYENGRSTINSPNPQRHIASLPAEVVNQLMREGRAPTQDRQAFLRWLDGPEGRIWKSYKGRVS